VATLQPLVIFWFFLGWGVLCFYFACLFAATISQPLNFQGIRFLEYCGLLKKVSFAHDSISKESFVRFGTKRSGFGFETWLQLKSVLG
jgi:hypothetical protein